MAKKRLSICMVLPFIIIVSVVGLFFTVTDPSSWPQDIMEFSPTDMRLLPSISTIWCESMSLSSSGDYVAYKVEHEPKIDSKMLTKQTFKLKLKMDNKEHLVNVHELKYFLLPGSIIHVSACASKRNANVYLFKREFSSQCFQKWRKEQSSEEEDSSEDESDDDGYKGLRDRLLKWKRVQTKEECTKYLMLTSKIPVNEDIEESECSYLQSSSLTFNVTSEDVYIIVVSSESPYSPNYIRLQIYLDRTFYNYHKIKKSMLMCSGSVNSPPPCNVPLTFASTERVLIWVPQAQESLPRQKFITISAQCKPRIAFFALLTVMLPVCLFAVLSFTVKTDRKRARQQRMNHSNNDTNGINSPRGESFVAPLLPEQRHLGSQAMTVPTEHADNCPPAYDAIFDLPPPYASLTFPEEKSQSS